MTSVFVTWNIQWLNSFKVKLNLSTWEISFSFMYNLVKFLVFEWLVVGGCNCRRMFW